MPIVLTTVVLVISLDNILAIRPSTTAVVMVNGIGVLAVSFPIFPASPVVVHQMIALNARIRLRAKCIYLAAITAPC